MAGLRSTKVKAGESTEHLVLKSGDQDADDHSKQVRLCVLGTVTICQAVRFGCGLIILSTTAVSLHIFDRTKRLLSMASPHQHLASDMSPCRCFCFAGSINYHPAYMLEDCS